MEKNKEEKTEESTPEKTVLGRALTYRMMTLFFLEENSKVPMMNKKMWDVIDRVEDANGKVLVTFCDPKIYLSPVASSVNMYLDADFLKRFWNIKPKFVTDPLKEYHNGAWIIGDGPFDFKEYTFFGQLENDIFVSVILSSMNDLTKITWDDWSRKDWSKATEGAKSVLKDKSLEDVRSVDPSIWWMDDNPGHGVGAFVYAHINKDDKIDSVIVDNWYFYPPTKPKEKTKKRTSRRQKVNDKSYFYIHAVDKDGHEKCKAVCMNDIKQGHDE